MKHLTTYKLFEDKRINSEDLEKHRDYFEEEYDVFWGKGDETEEFDEEWEHLLNTDFSEGGFTNIPDRIEISRLVTTEDIKPEKNIHWVRKSDEELFKDRDWLMTVGDVELLSIIDNPNTASIIRSKVSKNDVDWRSTMIQNLTFPHEREITLNRDFVLTGREEKIPYGQLLEYIVPKNVSWDEWKKMRKKGMTPAKYHKKNPKSKFKVVHGHKKGEIGKALPGAGDLSYEKASKMHSAIAMRG